jgi:hypothetical protein
MPDHYRKDVLQDERPSRFWPRDNQDQGGRLVERLGRDRANPTDLGEFEFQDFAVGVPLQPAPTGLGLPIIQTRIPSMP